MNNNKVTKQLLEDIVKKVVKETIKEELKPIKVLFYSLLKEQVSSKETKQKPVVKQNTTKEETKINPTLQSLLEQTTPFNEISAPSTLQEQISNVPVNLDGGTDMFANMNFRGFMQKVEEKANNTYRP
jgi:hypothetical protein